MQEKIKDVLLYGGVSALDYANVRDRLNYVNRIFVNAIAGLASVLTTALFLMSYSIEGIGMNRAVYGLGALVSILMLVCSLVFSERFPRLTVALVHLSYIVFYGYGIIIGTIMDPGGKTVTFMVMLVFLPILFTVPPLQTLSITLICEVVFILLCFQNKTGAVLDNDVVHAILFGFLGSITGVLITYMKIKLYVNELHLREVSRTDRLTGMESRNAYELDLYTIPQECKKSLACIYIDVNGLKTANDNYGHKVGDKMLVTVAQIIMKYFGDYHTYRLGGDEFIVFIPDIESNILTSYINAMKRDIEKNKYHVAVGWDKQYINELSLSSLQKNAELKMYQDKSLFYKDTEYERRRQ